MATDAPRFRDPDFLADHIQHTMAFYHPRCIDRERGGFFHFFTDDGSIYDADTRHLVSSTRFVFNYAMASRRFGDAEYLDGRAPRRGLPARGAPQPGDRRLCLAARTRPTRSWTAPTIATAWPSSCWPTPRR